MFVRLHENIRLFALSPVHKDWRYAVLLAWLGSLGVLALGSLFMPYQQILAALGVPPITPIFADLRAVLGGFEASRLGYDVLFEIPKNLYVEGRLIYPRLWMQLEWLGLGLHHANLLGILGAFGFVLATLSLVGRLNRYEALVYALVLCSPTALLLFERGNVDIVLYLLLFLSLLAVSRRNGYIRFLGYLLILLPSCLKLLPILTLSMALKETRARFLLCTIGLMAAFLAYMQLVKEEMKIIRSFYGGTGGDHAFGAKVIYWDVFKALKTLAHDQVSGQGAQFAAGVVVTVALVCVLALGVSAWCAFRQFGNWGRSAPALAMAPGRGATSSPALDAFRAGASLYIFTFVLGVVFDYKLMFLLLTMPQMLLWIKTDRRLGPVSSLALLGVVATCYMSPLLYRWTVDELVNWMLWAYMLYAFILTLPQWVRALAYPIWTGLMGLLPRQGRPETR